jgi:hypothetical protein
VPRKRAAHRRTHRLVADGDGQQGTDESSNRPQQTRLSYQRPTSWRRSSDGLDERMRVQKCKQFFETLIGLGRACGQGEDMTRLVRVSVFCPPYR